MSTQQAAAETNGTKPATRIAIVGTGQVGGAAAYALILSHVADELLLVDSNPELRDGQVRDLTDVAYSHQSRTRVHAGSYHEAGQCDIIVLAAGCKYTTGQTTIENVSRNISIVRTVVDAMRPFQPNAILLVVANPVDLLTSLAQKLSRLPPAQVLGSGTFLDSLRLRGLLADRAGVALDSVHVDILGVHGDPQVVAWSAATIGGSPVDKALPPPDSVGRAELESECRTRSRTIIRAKGATPFGIGSAVTTICASILQDRRSVRPVSHFHPESDCCYSLPAVLGRKGVLSTIPPHLNQEEETSIRSSAKELQATVERILLHGHRSI